MAKKVVEVELKTVGAEEAVADINDVSQSLNKLEKQEKGTTQQTEKLTTRVSENGGAMGILNQLTGGMAQTFKDAGEAVGLTGKSLKGLKGALLATGIGIAVIAVGALINNFDKVTAALGITNPRLEKFNETVGEAEVAAANASRGLETLRDVVLDVTADEKARTEALARLSETVKGLNGVTLDQEDALKKVVEMTQPYIEASQKRAKADAFAALIAEEEAEQIKERIEDIEKVEKFEAIAAKNQTRYNIQRAEVHRKRLDNAIAKEDEFIAMLNEKYMQLTEEALAAESVTRNLNDSFEEQTKAADETAKSIEKSTKATKKEVEAKTLAQKAFEKDLIDNQFFIPGVGYVSKETFKVLKEKRDKALKEEKEAKDKAIENDKAVDKIQADFKNKMEDEAADTELKKIELQRDRKLAELKLLEATESEKADIIAYYNQQVADATKKQDELAAKEKEERLQQTIGSLVSIVGASSKFGKGIAAANAIRDTFAGANKAFSQGGIFGFVQAAAIIASGLKNVKTIMGTKDPAPPSIARGSSAGSETTVSIPSASTPSLPPQFNTVGASGVNQLAQALGGQAPVRAFVVSGDVSTAQEMDRNIVSSASLG
jgi:hypothetical protein